MNVKIFKNLHFLLLILIFSLGFLVRLYRFDGPVADWHSWRQADTSAVSRNFAENGFNFLYPKFDDLSNVPSGRFDNPNGYRFVEFPIYNAITAISFKIFPAFTIEEWGRLVTIFASLISAMFLFLIIGRRFGKTAGLLVSFFFLFLPFNIYYSRTILPDPSMVTAILGATYFFELWLTKDKKYRIYNLNFLLSLLLLTSALLLKPYAIFFILPIAYLAFEKFGKKFYKQKKLWFLMILSLVPLILWRLWMMRFPEGIPLSGWLFNGNHIRFRPSFFRWILYERLTKLILGYFGLIFFIVPFINNKLKRADFYYVLSFLLSSILYVVILATGNVQHDYYQILVIPSISIILGLGSLIVVERINKYKKYLGFIFFLIITFLSFYFSWGLVKDYFNINDRSIIAAGKAVDKLTPKNAKVIANYNGNTAFLYQTKRKGWASFEKSLPEMIHMGASYLILANPTTVDLGLGKTYKIIAITDQYVIFDLKQKP